MASRAAVDRAIVDDAAVSRAVDAITATARRVIVEAVGKASGGGDRIVGIAVDDSPLMVPAGGGKIVLALTIAEWRVLADAVKRAAAVPDGADAVVIDVFVSEVEYWAAEINAKT